MQVDDEVVWWVVWGAVGGSWRSEVELMIVTEDDVVQTTAVTEIEETMGEASDRRVG